MKILKNYLLPLALVHTLVPACLPLILPGFYEPHDLHHLADIHQMFRALSTGQLPPRLGPDFTWGFGYPLFHFYYVLPFYFGAIIYWISGSLVWSFKLVFLIAVILSVFGMYAFLRLYIDKISSFTGAFVYLYTPYRAVQLYVRGAMGEALSIALLPWVAWALVRLIRKKTKSAPMFILLLGLYLLSHNYLWVLTIPFLGLLAVFELSRQKNKIKSFRTLLFSILASLSMTCYWWFPALIDRSLVAEKTPFLLEDHFPFIKQLLFPSWGYGSSVWGPGDEISFQLGLVNIASIILLGILMFRRKYKFKARFLAIVSILGFTISIYFMNIRSYFIWKALPFYDFIQFPWRLLFLTGLFSSIAASVFVANIRQKKLFSLILVFSAFVLTYGYFKPSKIVFNTDEYYLNRFFNDPGYSEDYLLLPKWTKFRPPSRPLEKYDLLAGEIISVYKANDIKYEFEVDADKDDMLNFNSYYFPGWTAEVDGQTSAITPQEPYGQIGVGLGQGRHLVKIFWKETQLRLFTDLISMLVFLGVILTLTIPRLFRLFFTCFNNPKSG